MTTTSSVSSSTPSATSAPTINTGNAQDVSSLTSGGVTLSLADAVTSKVQPYIDQATAVQTEINTNQTQIAAYQNMQSLLTSLQSSVANLTSESIEGTNVFNNRVANLSSNSSVAASSILSATVANGTTAGNHTVTVNQLAAAESDTSATLALGASSSISTIAGAVWPGDGTVTIAESGKSSPQGITINSAMSLSEVAAAINGVTATNGVTASVVSVDSSHQVLVLSAVDPDQQLNFTDSTPTPGLLQYLGITASNLTGSAVNPTPTAGSFTINSGGQSATVNVAAGDSLATIAANITSAAVGTNITASVVNNQLVIGGDGTNPLSFSGVTGTALSTLGFAASGAVNQGTAPQSALLTVDGVSGITRSSNTISDILQGVTLNLTQASSSTQVSLQIAPDTNGVGTAISDFVTAYNSWESFVQQNEATASGGGAAAGAVLFGDSTLRDASLQIDSAITESVLGTSLGAVGISLNSSNQLTLDNTTLSEQLSTNFSTVANLFQSSVTTDSTNLQPSTTDYSSFTGQFTLGVTSSGGTITGLTLNGANASSDFSFSGNTISGLASGPYAGMYFTYSGGDGTDNITVTSAQGIANQLYNTANNYGNTLTGSVQNLITSDQNQDLSYTTQYNTLIDEANSYTNFLVQQYSSLTSQIQSAGQTLTTLTALMNAGYNSNG
jgi:flagellar hook-associated protein 2